MESARRNVTTDARGCNAEMRRSASTARLKLATVRCSASQRSRFGIHYPDRDSPRCSASSVSRRARCWLKTAGDENAAPVGCYLPLRFGERQRTTTHLLVQEILYGILLAGVRLAIPRLGPQVRHVCRRAAQLETDEMVQLLVAERHACQTIGGHLVALDPVRDADRRPNAARVPRAADRTGDVRLRNARIHGAGCAGTVREAILTEATRGLGSRRWRPCVGSRGGGRGY